MVKACENDMHRVLRMHGGTRQKMSLQHDVFSLELKDSLLKVAWKPGFA